MIAPRRFVRHLIVPLLVVVGCLLWLLHEFQGIAKLRTEIEAEHAFLREGDGITWDDSSSLIDGLIEKLEFWQDPLSLGDWHELRRAYHYFKRRVDQPPDASTEPVQRMLDLTYFARVAFAIRQFSDTEKALRELIKMAESVPADDGTRTLPTPLLADARNSLSCLLVNYRDLDEARVVSQTSVEMGQALLEAAPGDGRLLMNLALALRNSGIIEELQGREGAGLVERSASAAGEATGSLEQLPLLHQIMVLSFVVDTHQMAGFLHQRHGRSDDAEAAWLRSRVACETLLDRIRVLDAGRERLPPHRRFRKAIVRLENDLQLLRDEIKPGPQHPPGPIEIATSPEQTGSAAGRQWMWTPLVPGNGLNLLSIDRLINGTLPGEFESQEAILMSWSPDIWCEATLLRMLTVIQETTQVVVLVKDYEVREDAVEQIHAAGVSLDRVQFFVMETDTVWCRDFGPSVVRCEDGAVRVARSMFADGTDDMLVINDSLAPRWARVTGWPIYQLPVLVESGALLSNGAGLCIASNLLLRKNAVSGIQEPQVTAALKRLTGASEVVYLEPIRGEPTEHVDWFATFTSPNTVVIGDYYGIDEENTRILDDNAGRLRGIMTPHGPLQVERIPMPPRGDGYFGGTYTNVVFANGNLLVPTWPEAPKATEKKALDVYRRLLPDWKIVPIDSQNFGRKFGSLHCATMNLYRYRPPQLLMGSDS